MSHKGGKPKKFTVIITRDEESGTFSASVPALQGCHTWGKTKRAAFRNALEAIEVYLEGLKKMGKRPPPDAEQRIMKPTRGDVRASKTMSSMAVRSPPNARCKASCSSGVIFRFQITEST